jgi:hypothetical protein
MLHLLKEQPSQDLIKKVLGFIGYPPKAVLYTMIQDEFPTEPDKKLKAAMDFLWEKQLIEVWENGWINGKKPEKKAELTKDDLDWYFGTGHYSQD